MSIGPRNYIVNCQLLVSQAPDRATAQEAAEQAMSAIGATLSTLASAAPTQLSAEKENGQFVFDEP